LCTNPVVTAVQVVDLGHPGILAQQIDQGTALNHSRCKRHSLPGASRR
jgi:hypothetical protein